MSGGIPTLLRTLSRLGVIPRAALTQLDQRTVPTAQSALDAGRLAEKTYQVLDQISGRVALLARYGQDLTQFGLTYSHLAFVVRGAALGTWSALHLLNTGDNQESRLFEEGLVNFFSDSPFRFQAGLLTLPPALQDQLLPQLLERPGQLHCPRYSLTSHPRSLTTQNSNQWVLEALAAALAGPGFDNREAVQAWLHEHHYTPSLLPIGLPTQWAVPLLRESIHFEDQPAAARRDGEVRTVTVDSVFAWLQGPQSPFVSEKTACRLITVRL